MYINYIKILDYIQGKCIKAMVSKAVAGSGTDACVGFTLG